MFSSHKINRFLRMKISTNEYFYKTHFLLSLKNLKKKNCTDVVLGQLIVNCYQQVLYFYTFLLSNYKK